MAYTLIHTSSPQKEIQSQALRLQHELQLIGHEVELSTATHPARLLKKNYDVFHILSETHQLNLKDQSLLLAAHLKNSISHLATVVSSFETTPAVHNMQMRLQCKFIDAFSTTELESLKSLKHKLKTKFILPFFPLNKIDLIPKDKNTKDLSQLKIVTRNFNELTDDVSIIDNIQILIDASELSLHWGTAQTRKMWRTFLKKKPQYESAVIILQKENISELLKNEGLLIDVSSLQNAALFQHYVDRACTYKQFLILNKNQASGFPHFWKHTKNCWILDLDDKKHDLKSVSKKFFKTFPMDMSISIEDKINEISRLYAKLVREKSLSYTSHKVSTP